MDSQANTISKYNVSTSSFYGYGAAARAWGGAIISKK